MKHFEGLEKAYDLILENEAKGTADVGSEMPKPGEGFKDYKEAKGLGGDSPAAKGVKAPKEMDRDLNPGHGTIAEDKEIQEMMPISRFDELFKATLVSEDFGEEDNPLEAGGGEEFNDEQGDFPGEGGEDTTSEEVDVATKLRMIIDELTEVATSLGAYEEEGGENDLEGDLEDDLEGDMGGEMGGEYDKPAMESAHAGGPGKGSDGKLKSFPDRTSKMTSKGGQKVSASSDMGKQTAAGHGKPGGPGQGNDGKLKSFPDRTTQMQGKGNMIVKGKVGTAGKSIFDKS